MPRESCQRLTEPEPEYVETGNVPDGYTYTRGMLKKRVKRKVNLLPDRFDALFRDIGILNRNGYLNTETWRNTRIDLLTDEEDPTGKFTDQSTYPTDEESPAITFGRELGKMINRLMSPGESKGYDDLRTDFVWGFIQGIGPQPPRGPSNNRFAVDCTEKVEERAKNTRAEYNKAVETTITWANQLRKNAASDNERVRETLETQDIGPEKWLMAVVRDEIKRETGIKDVRATSLSSTVDSIEEVITHERVQRLITEKNLLGKQQLVYSIERGREDAADIDRNGIPGTDVLLNVPSKGVVTTRKIAEVIDTAKSSLAPLAPVAAIGQHLSGERDLEGRSWNEPPVFEIDTDNAVDFAHWNWRLLPYGEILKHRVHARAKYEGLPLPTLGEARPLRDIPDEVVEAALDEPDYDSAEQDRPEQEGTDDD